MYCIKTAHISDKEYSNLNGTIDIKKYRILKNRYSMYVISVKLNLLCRIYVDFWVRIILNFYAGYLFCIYNPQSHPDCYVILHYYGNILKKLFHFF